MDFLEKLGDWFGGLLSGLERMITRWFGSANERRVRAIGYVRDKQGTGKVVPGSVIDRINQLEPDLEKLSDGELKETATRLRAKLADGHTLDSLAPEAFAAVREAGKRYLRMRHYDVQLVGGYILHQGTIAEMSTGEGKTLVATAPAFLNGLAGRVHVVTVNDYLARRDMEWMGPLHLGLGLTVGAIQSNMSATARKQAYGCDITYGTNNEFGFDYLRDNMKPSLATQVQGRLNYAIIDEIDNILIDEARTPLIISGPAHDDVSKYPKADRIARQLTADVHFEIKEKEHTCHLTDEGIRYAEEIAGVDSFYTMGNMEWPHLIDNALRAHHLYKRDVSYMVRDGEIIIVDEHTGRPMEGRQWSDGLHQAVEAKEGVKIKEESQTLATITLQNFFKLYKKISGMTGTAMTEANEFWKIYKLDVVNIPTNKPMRRINHPDAIYRTVREKWDAICEEVADANKTGRPILVGTVSIENSELLSAKLTRKGVKHNVLNAKHHEREAEIIAQAGRVSAVTIATNMAGRGTDIILGGNPEYLAWDELKNTYENRLDVPKAVWDDTTKRISEQEGMSAEGRKVAELGGLYVIGTERHDARRIDLQLRGRSGRQGDPGDSRFIVSLEDDLMRKFAGDWVRDMMKMLGMQEGERIESKYVTSQVEKAQKRVEERHFEARKHLLEYDEVMNEQRKRVYGYRQAIIEGANCRELILGMIERQTARWTKQFLADNYRWETIVAWAKGTMDLELDPSDVRERNYDQLVEFLNEEAERQGEDQIRDKIDENLPRDVEDEREHNWQAMSRWANSRFGLNTNDRELKRIGLDELPLYLAQRAKEALARQDYEILKMFLDPDFGRRQLAGWIGQQYGIEFPVELILGKEPAEIEKIVRQAIEETYARKEIDFPVNVGMARFLAESQNSGGERYDREGLAQWASGRFQTRLDTQEIESKPRHWIAEKLLECSQRFRQQADPLEELDRRLTLAYGALVSADKKGTPPPQFPNNPAALHELVQWANTAFQANFDPVEFAKLDRVAARQKLIEAREQRYRPELNTAERMLVLDVLDNHWKDHLYFMDYLRSSVALVGYAQKDPKIEYRREGMREFEQMWDRIADQVTQAVFRLEQISPDFVSNAWEITSTTHAAPPVDDFTESAPSSNGDGGRGLEPGQTVQAVEPIRNFGNRVGRNDPCPCGSGKKYKKCCGA